MRRRFTIMGALFAALLALSAPPARANEKFIVFFQSELTDLDSAAEDVVPAAIANARQNPAMPVEITGFASTDGDEKANQQLSLARAQKISAMIAAVSIAPGRLRSIGKGEVKSVGTAEEARRVEVVVRAP